MKTSFNKVICLLLALCLLFSLAACGKKPGSDTPTEETPAYVYSSSFTTVTKPAEVNWLNVQAAANGGFYATASVKVGDETPEGVTPEYEGQYWVYETQLFFIGADGSMTRLENYSKLPYPGELPEEDSYSSSGIAKLCADGNELIVLEEIYAYWYDAPAGVERESDEWWSYYNSEDRYFIRRLDSTGAELSSTEVDLSSLNLDSISIYAAEFTPEGTLLLACDTEGVVEVAADGSILGTIATQGWTDNLVRAKDGSVYALDYSDGYTLARIDTASHSFGDKVTLNNWPENLMSGSGDYDFYYTSGVTLYGVKADGTTERVFTWISVDINNDNLSAVTSMEDGSFLLLNTEWDEAYENATNQIIRITSEPYDAATAKQTLVLATTYLNSDTKDAVIRFNRTHSDVRIDVKEYNDSDVLYTEMLSGTMPDLVDLSSVPQRTLAVKGLLEDLLPYLEKDSELQLSDFLPNVLQACEMEGKLYTTVSGFALQTLVGAASLVGDEPGWTYRELLDAYATMPEGASILNAYTDRYQMLQTCLYMEESRLVNWSTGKCDFNSDTFKQLLEFSNNFVADYNWDDYDWNEDTATSISSGKQMLMYAYLYNLDDLFYYDMTFGGNATFIGYPTSEGVGSVLNVESGYGMTSSCKNKDAAWDFLRTFFTESYQKNSWHLPSRVDLFEQVLTEAMTPQYEKNEKGEYVLDENGQRIEVMKYTYWVGEETIEASCLTQAQVDKFRQAVTTATRGADYDESIYDIVVEQAEAYYAGQKSLDEVAKLVQSKANIYVNEQR